MIQTCPHCNAPLTILNSLDLKQCIDYKGHKFSNRLKEGQKPLVQASR